MTDPESLLQFLDVQQRQAATTLRGPVVIIAGAGSGKTSVITRRIAYGVHTGTYQPERTVAVTFTTKAAGEMTRRLRQLDVSGVRVRTFHAAALRQLRYYWPKVVGGTVPEVIASKSALIGAAATAVGLSNNPAAVRDAAADVEWAKMQGIAPQALTTALLQHPRPLATGLAPADFAKLFTEYERRKQAAARIDFEDVLLLTVGILEADKQVAAHVRSGISHLTVDEFQDVSPLQQRLINAWLGSNQNLCVVGDPMQTIYSFAGADASYLENFAKRYSHSHTFELMTTYRCSPQIVAVANKVLQQAGSSRRLHSHKQAGPAVQLLQATTDEDEAVAVADAIAASIAAGTSAHEIAVLYRLNAMSQRFEEQLSARHIPYQVMGGTGFFRRPEVRKAIAVLRAAALAGDAPVALNLAEQVAELLRGAGWAQSAPTGTGAMREQWESLAALHQAAVEFLAHQPEARLRDFTSDLAERAEHMDAPDTAGVTLMSLHGAKGMEWQQVFLVGLCEGILPHAAAVASGNVDEERRLMYVGVTRAKQQLTLSWAKHRSDNARERTRSRFLDFWSEAANPASGSTARTTAHAKSTKARSQRGSNRVSTCRICKAPLTTAVSIRLRRCPDCPAQVNESLLIALRQWRSTVVTAKSAGRERPLPAYLVATDATLQAIAESSPRTLEQLGSVAGIGPVKLQEYGADLLKVIEENSA